MRQEPVKTKLGFLWIHFRVDRKHSIQTIGPLFLRFQNYRQLKDTGVLIVPDLKAHLSLVLNISFHQTFSYFQILNCYVLGLGSL